MGQQIQVRGAAFLEDISYISSKRGDNGLDILEDYLRKEGCYLPLRGLGAMDLFPITTRVTFLNGVIEALGWSREKLFKMSINSPSVSTVMKFFLKYVVGIETAFKSAPKYWDNYFTGGRLEAAEFEKGRLVLRLYDFTIDPIMCLQLSGYFLGVAMSTRVKGADIKETRCVHEGSDHCEFVITYDP